MAEGKQSGSSSFPTPGPEEQPRQQGCSWLWQEDVLGGGTPQPDGLEPLTVLPGRGRAIKVDVEAALEEFERQLSQIRGSACSAQAATLPRSGAFALLRELFRDRALSLVVERGARELARDLVQFAAGVCWAMLLRTSALERRVGIVFLVYLFYHAQHPYRFAIPVDPLVLEALAALREECEGRQVLLECPEILRRLVADNALSVGLRATCRNLHFDRLYRLVQRQSYIENATAIPSGVKTQRLVAAPTAGAISMGGGEEKRELDLESVLGAAQEYEALSRGAVQPVAHRLAEVGRLAAKYQRSMPPEPKDLVLEDGIADGDRPGAQEEQEEVAPRKLSHKRRRRRRVPSDTEESSSSASEDSLLDRLDADARWQPQPQEEPAAEDTQPKQPDLRRPVRLPSKRARHSERVGLKKSIERGGAVVVKPGPPPSLVAHHGRRRGFAGALADALARKPAASTIGPQDIAPLVAADGGGVALHAVTSAAARPWAVDGAEPEGPTLSLPATA